MNNKNRIKKPQENVKTAPNIIMPLHEIHNTVKITKPNKAAGFDGVYSEFF